MHPDPLRLRVLVIDDRPSVCETVVRLLNRLGIAEVYSVNDGSDALRAVAESDPPFDLTICDVDMPQNDGLVYLRGVAAQDRRPAVILMSGKDPMVLESARRLGQDLGVNIPGTLHKPVTTGDLRRLLGALSQSTPVTKRRQSVPLSAPEIEEALRQRWFELWFQPQYDIASATIRGAEAVVRLKHPERGIIQPDAFIGPAEALGLIGPLTEVVLVESVKWCSIWQADGLPLTVSLNVSNAGLTDLTLPDRVALLCREAGVPPGRLTFELTESSLAANTATVLDILTRLRLKGFGLSLDDFGTGYASLKELQSLPFHELKLDKQFVMTATESSRSRTILENSVSLATQLGLRIVAEGVESEAILRLVAAFGCDVAQGHYVGRPTPADDFQRSVATRGTVLPVADTSAKASITGGAYAAEGGDSSLRRETVLQLTHDAASPLMVVLGLVESVLEESGLTAEQRFDLEQVRRCAEEVASLLKQLRGLAQLPADRPAARQDSPRET